MNNKDENAKRYNKNSRRNGIIIAVIVIIIIILASISGCFLYNRFAPADSGDGTLTEYPTIDRNVEKAPESTGEKMQSEKGGGSVRLNFSKEVRAQTGDGEAQIMFENPSVSNQNLVLHLQITDKELLSKIGRTGRTPEDIKKIEEHPNYNSETSRMTIATTGVIETGYKVTKLQLNKLPDGTVLPKGEYEGIFYFDAYDEVTKVKAKTNIQIPVNIIIGE